MSRGRARLSRAVGPAAGHPPCVLLEICAMAGGLGTIAHARIKECSVRSSGLPSLCWGWSRISPCPSFGRCWRRFLSACLAGGWRTAATGSDGARGPELLRDPIRTDRAVGVPRQPCRISKAATHIGVILSGAQLPSIFVEGSALLAIPHNFTPSSPSS